jgi:glucose 1-dehydrogenase
MRGVAAFPESVAPRFVELPEPAPPGVGQVLCRTLELGICGTDREILASAQPWTAPGAEFLVLGHECLARVVAVGPGVASVRAGDLVVPLVRRARPLPPGEGRGEGNSPPGGARQRGRRVDMLPIGHYVERGIVIEHGFSLPYWLYEPQ